LSPMRILLGVHEFFPDFAAGTEVITLSVARQLRQRGHDVRLVSGYPAPVGTISDAQRFDQYTFDGFTIHRFKHSYEQMGSQPNVMENEYFNELFGTQFGKLLDQIQPNIVHFFNLGRLSASCLDACFIRKIPAFFTATDFWAICPLVQLRLPDNTLCNGPDPNAVNCIRHLADLTCSPRVQHAMNRIPDWGISLALKAARNKLIRFTPYTEQACAMSRRREVILTHLNRARTVFAPSKLMAQMLQSHGLSQQVIRYLPYGVDVSGITRAFDKGTHERLRIGFIGTVSEHKAPHLLVEAVSALPHDLPVDVTIWGPEGNQISYIQRLHFMARQQGRIHFAGAFANGTLNCVLAQIDLLVVPSLWLENTPMVIYEALAGGVPVIATDLAGMTEAIPAGAGVVFTKGDTGALARIITELANDRSRVAQMSAACRSPMSIEDHVAALEKAYGEGI
jgi:glycosyltransferase involved in cell wall biosynthesis